MTTTANRFQYSYEDTLEESVEASLAPWGEYFGRAARWRPSAPLLFCGAFCGACFAGLSHTLTAKLVSFAVPIILVLLLTISSKKTRIEGARRQAELLLRKNYNEKRCHVHNISIDEIGVVEMCPCGTDTRNWQAFKRWHETERMIAIEALNKSLYVIPKRVIQREELQALRDLLSKNIPQATPSI
jgi:hypothetical protein